MLLAEVAAADVSAQSLKDWLAILFYIVAGVASIVGLWKMLSGKPDSTEIAGQPIEVKAHAAFATKEELQRVETAWKEDVSNAIKSRKGMHMAVEDQAREIAAIKKETSLQSDTLKELKTDTKAAAKDVATMAGEMKGINTQLQHIALTLQAKKQ